MHGEQTKIDAVGLNIFFSRLPISSRGQAKLEAVPLLLLLDARVKILSALESAEAD